MLLAVNTTGKEEAKPIRQRAHKCYRLFDYAATDQDTYIWYHAIDMYLHVDSDISYLVMLKAQSRIAGYYQLLDCIIKEADLNGPLIIECKTLRNVVASATEAEMDGLYQNAQTSIPVPYNLRITLSSTTTYAHRNLHYYSIWIYMQ